MWVASRRRACAIWSTVAQLEVYASLPRYLVPGFQSSETCRRFQPQGPLRPQELCTLFCKGVRTGTEDGVVGLDQSYSSYQLVNILSHGTVSSSSSSGLRGTEQGWTGWPGASHVSVRTIDIPRVLSANGI